MIAFTEVTEQFPNPEKFTLSEWIQAKIKLNPNPPTKEEFESILEDLFKQAGL